MTSEDLEQKLMELWREDPYFLDGHNMTEAVKKLKELGVKTSFKTLQELTTKLIPKDGLEIPGHSGSVHLDDPEIWKGLGLGGTPQYVFVTF